MRFEHFWGWEKGWFGHVHGAGGSLLWCCLVVMCSVQRVQHWKVLLCLVLAAGYSVQLSSFLTAPVTPGGGRGQYKSILNIGDFLQVPSSQVFFILVLFLYSGVCQEHCHASGCRSTVCERVWPSKTGGVSAYSATYPTDHSPRIRYCPTQECCLRGAPRCDALAFLGRYGFFGILE